MNTFLIYIAHPAHVHFFKNFIEHLTLNKNKFFLVIRDKDITLELINEYKLNKHIIQIIKPRKPRIGSLIELLETIIKFIFLILKYKINVGTAIGCDSLSVACKLLFKKSFAFTDTEAAKETNFISSLFATNVLVPSCFEGKINKRTIIYNGSHELAYLHPAKFVPNPNVLNEIGLTQGDPFFIIRFVSWRAIHDIGNKGFSISGKEKIIQTLEKYGKFIITSEVELPASLRKHQMTISPTKIHDLLYYATMYIGEGGTMASEAAVLGTPSVFVSSLTAGVFKELEEKYHLLYSFQDENYAIEKINQLLEDRDLKKNWLAKKEEMLKDKVDVTQWMIDFFENEITFTD